MAIRNSFYTALGFLLLLHPTGSQALEISRNGMMLTLSGPIQAGDDLEFRDAVERAPTKIINLNSNGGFVKTAGEIGRLIRSKGLTTVVDASHAECVSACTLIFASGTTRLYVHADQLSEGAISPKGFTGLGYHEGSSAMSLAGDHYSGFGTGYMIDFYYEFGSSEAAKLITKAPPTLLYRISGATAVAMGLATGTGKP